MTKAKPDIRPYTKQFYKENRVSFLVALCGTLLITGASLLVSWLLQQLIDLIGGCDTGFTLYQLIGFTLLLIGMVISAELIRYHSEPVFITRGITRYKAYLFGELTRKNIASFSKENTATYISALTNDIQAIEQGYLKNIFSLTESLATCCGAVVLMLWYSPLLTLAAFGLALLPLTASILTGTRMAKAEKNISDRNEIYTSTLKDSLGGFSVIKSFKAEAQMIRMFRTELNALSAAQCRKQKLQILVQTFASVAGITAQLGIFIFGAFLAVSGKGITAGMAMIFVQLMNYILSPIQTIPTFLAERKAARALVEKVAVLLSANLDDTPQTEPIQLQHGIRINHLTFGYKPETPVLRDLQCTFSRGRAYAIVGASGCGKSTLLNLLLASYSGYEGTIAFDERELHTISSEQLYDMVSVIQQNVFIFNASIRDNITMFSDFPGEEVRRAIEQSGLSALIAAHGQDYLCGENGSNLSGGEKQRISIARSLLKKSQVLLVDEATAALDAQTAFQISNAILDMDGLTRIVVTHSLDAKLLKRYDCILTLKNGCIAESGTFEELMEAKGYFYSLYTVSQ